MYAQYLPVVLSSVIALAALPCFANENLDWLRGRGQDLELRLSGKLERQSGGAVDDVSVTISFLTHHGQIDVPAQVQGNQYHVWLPVNRHDWHSLRFVAIDLDSNEAEASTISRQNLRKAIVEGYDVILSPPSRTVAIRLHHTGTPISHAKVRVQAGSHNVEAISNTDGIATVAIYGNDDVNSVVAYTNTLVGGFQTWRKPKRDPKANSYDCAMHPIRRQAFRILNKDGESVPGVSLRVKFATASPNYNYFGDMPYDRVTTNGNGEAFHERFPDWDDLHCFVDILDPKWFKGDDLTWDGGVATQIVGRMPARTRVTGKLVGETIASLSVCVQSFQHPQDSFTDIRQVYSDADGNFAIDLLPGATYVAFVDDPVWVTPMMDWLMPVDGAPKPLKLNVSQGVRTKAIVTAGQAFQPIENARVRFFNKHPIEWTEGGRRHLGEIARITESETGPDGIAESLVLPGTVEVSGMYDGWIEQKEVEVVKNESVLVELHRPFAAPQKVIGQLVSTNNAKVDFSGARIFTGAIDGASRETMDTLADATGKFKFQTTATHFGVYVETADGRFAGITKSRDVTNTLKVKLLPTMTYRGRLLNKSKEPIANHKVSIRLRVEGKPDYDAPYQTLFPIRDVHTRTDVDGYYVFEGLPAHLPMRIHTYAPHDPQDFESLGKIYLQPGENLPLAVAHIDDGSPVDAMVDPQPTLEERFAKIMRDCRLNGYRMMIIRHTGRNDATKFTSRFLTGYRHQKDIARYMPLLVDKSEPLDEDDAAFAEDQEWPMVVDGAIFVSVLGTNGNEIDRMTLNIDSTNAAETAKTFIARYAPLPVDAKKKWEEAFALAKETGRRVWAIQGGRYCGPCLRLTRWINEHADLLAQDYVFFKVDAYLDEHGADVAERITRGGQHGVPFYAIFSADGQFLVDSEGPTGNIGMPSGFEGVQHLGKMLHETRRELPPRDVNKLLESLR